MKRKQLVSTLLLLLTAFIWGSAFVAQSVGAEYVGAFTFLTARSFISCLAVLPVAVVSCRRHNACRTGSRAAVPFSLRRYVPVGGLCGFFLCVASAAQQAGMAYTTTAKAGFITSLYVVLVPCMGLVIGKRPGLKIWIGVLLGVCGLYLLSMHGGFGLEKGDALMLLCALLFTGHIMCVDRFAPKLNGVAVSCIQFFMCGVFSLVGMLLFETPSFEAVRAAGLAILYAGLFSGGIGYTLQIVAQKDLDPTVASLLMSLESVFSALCGWSVLGQTLTSREFFGCCLMAAAIVMAQLPERRPAGQTI
ncbi:MAG: DMT family transporter [Mailhella sp.]|nr:DMT family transporter [Mailhella sp.]